MTQLENCRPVEVTGQVRGVRMNPPGDGDGGTFWKTAVAARGETE